MFQWLNGNRCPGYALRLRLSHVKSIAANILQLSLSRVAYFRCQFGPNSISVIRSGLCAAS